MTEKIVSIEQNESPMDPITGKVLINKKTGNPYKDETELKEHRMEMKAKFDTVIELLSDVFEDNAILITANGIAFSTNDPNNLYRLCKTAKKDLERYGEDILRVQGFGQSHQLRVPVLEYAKKIQMQRKQEEQAKQSKEAKEDYLEETKEK